MATRRTLALAFVLLLLAAACGDAEETAQEVADDPPDEEPAEDDSDDEADQAVEEDDADDDDRAADEDDADESAPGGTEVAVADSPLGDILVDGEGLTLYLFDVDEDGESACYDDCATNWPPLLTEDDPVAGDDVDGDLLGTTERDDGTLQVTYADHPLYYWIGDDEPGDVDGQAVQEVWWVLDADGEAIHDEADDDTETGGY